VELLGEVAGSGYRRAPSLVRRADGQVLQLTPILYAALAAVDGRRDVAAIARVLATDHGLVIDPEDVEHLLETKLRPLGVLRGQDGDEPVVARSNPLLALRWRVIVSNPAWTRRIAAPFASLFAAPVVVGVLGLFAVVSGWLLFEEGLAGATRQALYEPGLLLLVVALSFASAGFHEVGHAAACVRGGARPGAMGAGLYLLWPAFYTDVSDSYRLARRDRLRVDLGGLYFNAVFAVAVFALWAATRADALLVVIPVQLLQMVRQLVPFVRFDGYHVLADLTGVPDLFARIKPTLLSLVPRRWGGGDRSGLKPWARAVITAWVLLVVPILLVSLLLMVVAFPRVAATTWDSLGNQTSQLVDHWSHGRLARAALGAVAVVAITLPVVSMTYLLSRMARRTWRRAWTATDERPAGRATLLLAAAAALVLLVTSWWPDGQYRPIDARDRGTLLDALPTASAAGADATGLPAADAGEPAAVPGGADTVAWYRRALGDGWGGTAASSSATGARPRHTFTPPAAPGDGDNQALAVNYEDGSSVYAAEPSLVWATDDSVENTNQAYALASCTDCTTVALAFQVVLVVGDPDEVAPVNEAVAVNHTCVRCATTAISMQSVLSVPDAPTDAELARLDALWSEAEEIAADLPSIGPAAAYAQLRQVEASIMGLLGPGADELASDHDVTDAPPGTEDAPATDVETTGTAPDPVVAGDTGGSTEEPVGDDPTTTTTAAEPEPTTTTAPPETTSTAPP
jgi:putative peptide zinc metalloprotease protein